MMTSWIEPSDVDSKDFKTFLTDEALAILWLERIMRELHYYSNLQ